MSANWEAVIAQAKEEAEIRVSALLTLFGQPGVGERQIREALVDACTRAQTAGYNLGWGDAIEGAITSLGKVRKP